MLFNLIFKRKKKNNPVGSKININTWMKLSKEQRLEIDSKEKNESMRKKKELLRTIRDEYAKIIKKK